MANAPSGGNQMARHILSGLPGDAINLFFGVSAYKDARKQGNNAAMSAAKAIGSFAWGEIFYGGMNLALQGMGISGLAAFAAPFALTMIPTGAQIAGQAFQNVGRTMDEQYSQAGRLGSGYFNMSQAGYTMRQRSLNAIQSNGLNTRSVLGNEARTFFRSSGVDAD